MTTQYKDLKSKTILITGVLRGIGNEIACSLAEQGAHIVFNYREGQVELANEFAKKLQKLGAQKVSPLLFDLTNNKQITESIKTFLKNNEPISGLVNNAGISKDQIVLRLKEEDIKKTIETNLTGSILVTSALSKNFLRTKNVSIINVSSVVGLMGNSSQISYSASKAGLIGFTKSIAKELASRNIRCNAICPGFIETDMTSKISEKVLSEYQESIPIKRMGTKQEVSNLINFLLSCDSSYITGEIIKIDGGLYI